MSQDIAPRGDRMVRFIESDQGGQTVSCFRLVVLDFEGNRTPCGTYRGAPADVLDEVEARALQQSNVLGGVNNFELQAIDPDGQVLGTEVFRVAAEGQGTGAAFTEPANEGGFMSQLMRHKEAETRLHIDGTAKLFSQMSRTMDQLAKRAQWAEAQHLQGLEAIQAAVLSERQHEIELVKVQGKAQAMNALASKVSGLLPDVAAGILGKVRDKSAAAALLARDLLESIDNEQFQVILGTLNPEQQTKILKLMQDLAKEAESEGATNATH